MQIPHETLLAPIRPARDRTRDRSVRGSDSARINIDINQSSAYDLLSRRAVAVMHSGQ